MCYPQFAYEWSRKNLSFYIILSLNGEGVHSRQNIANDHSRQNIANDHSRQNIAKNNDHSRQSIAKNNDYIKKNVLNKSCSELNILQKIQCTYVFISFRSGVEWFQRPMLWKYFWNGKVDSLQGWTLQKYC